MNDDTIAAERKRIMDWLENCAELHEEYVNKRGQKMARRHHADACRMIRNAIGRGEHNGNYREAATTGAEGAPVCKS